MYQVKIDYSRNALFDDLGIKRLKDSYMRDEESDPQERFAYVSEKFSTNSAHAQRLYDYSSSHWLSYSTPILSFGRSKKGLPISCYLNYIDDTAEGLVENLTETNWLSMLGGGVGIHMGIRGVDDKSTGLMPHIKTYESSCQAYRQGRCYIPGTEILTSNGWKVIEDITLNDIVATIEDDGSLKWDKPSEIVKEIYKGKMINFFNENRGINFTVTEDHSMVIMRKSRKTGWGSLIKVRASDVPQHNEARFLLSSINSNQILAELSPQEQLDIAFQADGHKVANTNAVEFHFSKDRKIVRLRNILLKLNMPFTESVQHNGTTKFYIPKYVDNGKDFKHFDLLNIDSNKANALLEEIAEWDGYRNRLHSFIYFNTNKEAVNIVQALAVIAGRSSRLNIKTNREGNRKDLYEVFIGNKPFYNLETLEKINIDYNGLVHCCVVPSGKIVVRNGSVPLVCGNTRRGSYAIYTDISHPDIIQFLEMRKPTGDPNLRALHLNHGINIPDSFMNIIYNCMKDKDYDDSWPLIQPNTGKVVEIVSAKELWAKLLDLRANTGEPYCWFIDTANNDIPIYQKAAGLKNNGSNLCSEISLVTSKERTAVCCLSSVNLRYYDLWKDDKKFLPDVLEMLDNVIQYFILNAPNEISRAKFSAYRERSVGIGVLGFHSYLQSKMIPFESAMAVSINKSIFKNIRTQLDTKNEELAISRGPCPDAAEYNIMKRNSHVMAIAPTASASIIMGNTSPSTEPYAANVYRQDTISGAFINKTKEFSDYIFKYAKENDLDLSWIEDQWESIIANKGSCQHLEWMPDNDKLVFKTAREIDQEWIISHAIDRQPYIDQAQSVNIYITPTISIPRLHMLHFMAWKGKLKGLYYCRSSKIGEIDKMSQKIKRVKIEDEIENTESVSNTEDSKVLIWDSAESSTCMACE